VDEGREGTVQRQSRPRRAGKSGRSNLRDRSLSLSLPSLYTFLRFSFFVSLSLPSSDDGDAMMAKIFHMHHMQYCMFNTSQRETERESKREREREREREPERKRA
jgi:hypothetical protein